MRSLWSAITLLVVITGSTVVAIAAAPAQRPNIIVIMSDDMGFSDIGCYGGDAQTPTLDALAAGGMRFTQFYNNARCCPTRASLLTGLYPHQAGIGHMVANLGPEGYRGTLSRQSVTIAEVLKHSGYRTYMCGKWHVAEQHRGNGDKSAWPLQRGFDKFYGTIAGGGSFYDPVTLCRQETFITPQNDPEYQPEQFYYTDAISDNAVKYLSQHQQDAKEQPFFMYVAYTAAHWPMHALPRDIAKYRGKFDDGYQPHRQARLERLQQRSLVDAQTPLSPAAEDWATVANKAWEARCMEVYCAMIDNMDAGIGRIVEQLQQSGQLENTLILFLQDNGGCAENMGRTDNGAGPNDLKPFAADQLQTQIWPPMQTRDGRWVKSGPGVMPGPPDTYVAYGRGWANVSNTPFREYKHWVHEGGISSPLIMHWPARIRPDQRGKLHRQPAHLIDIMATCVDAAGAMYPTTFAGQTIKPREGVSMLPALQAESFQRSSPLFWEHEGNRAVRDGQWKLVAKENQPWELYDISQDRTESHNLAAEQPERVQQMAAAWDAFAARANVLPLGAWRNRSGNDDGNTKKLRFELKAEDQLTRAAAPAIGNRGITITAEITVPAAGQGVIVAHGGAALGYALWLENGVPHFRIRTDGQSFDTAGTQPLTGQQTIIATLGVDRSLSLAVGERKVAPSIIAALLPRKPVDGLDIGRDTAGAVGNYQPPNPFNGTIHRVQIDLAVE